MKKKTIGIILIFILVIMLGFGIAYAYFAARIIGQEKASTISLTGGKMIIEYSENSGVIELSGIYPKTSPWATKIITIKGTNTTDLIMKYDLGLNVTENTFKNSYISYDLKLIDGDNGAPISNITGKYINGTGYKRFGIGSFANANEEVHQYELKIYFKNNGKDQNDAQRAIFNARVVITDAGSINPNEKRAMFLGGDSVIVKMKTLANLANGDDTTVNANTINTTITAIKESNAEPTSENKDEKNIVSTTDSDYPIYMWYDDGTIYWWSLDKHPKLAFYGSRFFQGLSELVDISGVSNWDASNMRIMLYMFRNTTSLSDLTPLSNWDVSNVNSMTYVFIGDRNITDLQPLAKWNTSNSTSMYSLFSGTGVLNLHGLENWDVSNVTDITGIFGSTIALNDISAISNWDVSNVREMSSLFSYSKINDISPLANWNVSNVTNMRGLFQRSKITDLNALKSWDVSKVTTLEYMCIASTIIDASGINDWDITSVTNFDSMFQYTSTHPEFTKIQGTWENGTFIPNS